MKKSLIGAFGVLFFLTGCAVTKTNTINIPQTNTQKSSNTNKALIKTAKYGNKTCVIDNRTHMGCLLRIEAKGVGVVPCNGSCNAAQARVMARRAAVLDAYRALIEKIYGIQINGRDSVKNMALQSSVLRSHIEGLVRGATIEDESFKNGVYSIVMSIKLNVALWNQYLQSSRYPYNDLYAD